MFFPKVSGAKSKMDIYFCPFLAKSRFWGKKQRLQEDFGLSVMTKYTKRYIVILIYLFIKTESQ